MFGEPSNNGLPKRGEQIDFEVGDLTGVYERMSIRVNQIVPLAFGLARLTGWRIGDHQLPMEAVQHEVSITTIKARWVHR